MWTPLNYLCVRITSSNASITTDYDPIRYSLYQPKLCCDEYQTEFSTAQTIFKLIPLTIMRRTISSGFSTHNVAIKLTIQTAIYNDIVINLFVFSVS